MQARTLKCFMAACGVAAAMACTDDRAAINPTMPPTRVSADLAAPGCDFNAMKQHAKGYFLAGNDPVYTLLQDWSALNKTTDAAAFKQKGFDIDRRKILLPDAIRALGESHVPVKLHRDVTAQLKITVVKE